MTKLIIVESNAKCKKIESFLSNEYKCIASFGHIREFTNGLKSIDKDKNYTPSYKFIDSKMKYVKNLKTAIRNCNEVILATDDDREGEAIAWHLCKSFNLSVEQTKRIKFNEITKPAILNALENHTKINMNKVNSQQARAILDILVGYTISPYLWKHVSRNSQSGLSAGRCQTPALKLIYEREEEIKNSPGEKAYDTIGNFNIKNHKLDYTLNYHHKSKEMMETFLEKDSTFEHEITKITISNHISKAPIPFTTSLLQQKSSNELHYSPKQTMRLAQTLYENGWITYMRTDCNKYSKEFVTKGKKYIVNKFGKEYVSSNINKLIITKVKTKKNNAQEAHEAIRPTKVEKCPHTCKESGKITSSEIRLYKLIWNNTMESMMSNSEYNKVTTSITAPEKHLYKRSEDQIIFPGWKIIKGYEENNKLYNLLTKLNKSKVNYNDICSNVKLKNLKTHYNEAKLVQLLEEKCIGRPSTFSSLIDKIQTRKYVLKQDVMGKKMKCVNFKLTQDELEEIEDEKIFGNEKNKLVIQPLGTIVLEFLNKYFENVFKYDYTKNMEDLLDQVETGKELWYNVCKNCDLEIYNASKKIPTNTRKMYKIDENHVYMIGKFGPVIKYDDGKGNTSFKNVKKDLDMKKLERNEYNLEDILEKNMFQGNILGEYEGENICLKNGKFGSYVNYKNKNYSLKFLKKDMDEITLQDAIKAINYKNKNPNVLKTLSENVSIRKGKYGPYVMVKKPGLKKPIFLKIKDKNIDEITIDWVNDNLL
jgi:DNA topoisomerase I